MSDDVREVSRRMRQLFTEIGDIDLDPEDRYKELEDESRGVVELKAVKISHFENEDVAESLQVSDGESDVCEGSVHSGIWCQGKAQAGAFDTIRAFQGRVRR